MHDEGCPKRAVPAWNLPTAIAIKRKTDKNQHMTYLVSAGPADIKRLNLATGVGMVEKGFLWHSR